VEKKYPVQRVEVSLSPNRPELIAWILGFGPDVRIIEPQALRVRIARLAQQMAKVHRER
jgi:predicted DNA-binding transcriptional regulator YafY